MRCPETKTALRHSRKMSHRYTSPHQDLLVLKQCFDQYDINDVFVAFNGGKDCTVLLDLTLDVLRKKFSNPDEYKKLKVYYIQPDHPFPELEEFIFRVKDLYKLNMFVIKGSIKEVLQKIIDDNKNMGACLMGTRSTDPYCENIKHFQMTDKGWPQIMRVSPLLNWSYHQIWSYLLERKVPYCKLYDLGFTSIGNTNNTIPNPALKNLTNGHVSYKPAYLLQDGSLERNGRVKNLTNGKL